MWEWQSNMLEWTYIGVNSSVPGNGGPLCAAYLHTKIRWIETIYTTLLAVLLISWGYKRLNYYSPTSNYQCLINTTKINYSESQLNFRKCLLILYCIIWIVEIAFKLASQTLIYLLNPCHMVTLMQLYLLWAVPNNLTVTSIFRLHLNYLNGAILAFVFPVLESRTLPFETVTYWLQHSMMLIVPAYLLSMGGIFTTEPFNDFSWNSLGYGFILLYHFIFLQTLAKPTQVNLNHMLCPMPDDPFASQLYRSAAVIHQGMLCPLSSKVYCLLQTSYFKQNKKEDKLNGNQKHLTVDDKIINTVSKQLHLD